MKAHAEEYIGSMLEVVQSPNSSLTGLHGKVINETKYTFVIETDKKEKRIMKKGNTFHINGKEVQGSLITKRPEERLKL
ncbi:MAG: ribonuclease P protein subunit [Nanoarchaeota archaeon]